MQCKASEYANVDDANITAEVREGDTYFWTGLVEDQNGVLINEYTNEPVTWDLNVWPGPVSNDSACNFARGEFIVEKDCDSTIPCGICSLKVPQKRLKLKGLCVDDMKPDSDFDSDYYAYGLVNDRIHFR